MFGVEPETLTNLINLQKQILAFMVSTTDTLRYIESQLVDIQDTLDEEREHG